MRWSFIPAGQVPYGTCHDDDCPHGTHEATSRGGRLGDVCLARSLFGLCSASRGILRRRFVSRRDVRIVCVVVVFLGRILQLLDLLPQPVDLGLLLVELLRLSLELELLLPQLLHFGL